MLNGSRLCSVILQHAFITGMESIAKQPGCHMDY